MHYPRITPKLIALNPIHTPYLTQDPIITQTHYYMTRALKRTLPLLLLIMAGCKKNDTLLPITEKEVMTTVRPMGITPVTFNWETVDWMPTPPGQSQIAPPWIGQGSLTSTYGIDVVSDHKASDGWVLLYNTFNALAPAPLVNPYFILYNRYRGLMRIYFYTTTQFVYPSTYVVDGMSVISNGGTTLLNYLGNEVVDPIKKRTAFTQIEPAPTDGSQPLAANRWYMLQYEMAYDPQITSLTSDNIQISWFTNFNSVSTIALGGSFTGTIKSAVGAPGTAMNSALQTAGKVAGQGALAWIGSAVLQNNGNTTTGTNTMGIGATAFKNIAKGLESALSAATGNFPGAIVGIFSAIFGGNSGSQGVNMNIDASINMTGTLTTAGSFPSSPTSLYVPGTQILSTAQNFVPLRNEPLGVFNLRGRPVIDITVYSQSDLWPAGTNTAQITFGYHATAPENDLFTPNPNVIKDGADGAGIAEYTEEPLFILWDSIYTAGGNYANGLPTILLSSRAQYEDKGASKVISSTGDLTDSNIAFTIISSGLAKDLAITGTGGWSAGDYLTHGAALRVRVTLHPNSGGTYITNIKTFVANVRIHVLQPLGHPEIVSPILGLN